MNSTPPQFDLAAELHEVAMNRLHSEVQGVSPLYPDPVTVQAALDDYRAGREQTSEQILAEKRKLDTTDHPITTAEIHRKMVEVCCAAAVSRPDTSFGSF